MAAGTVVITNITTRATLRRDHERQEDEQRRRMTERLYDRRVEVYPGLFEATDAFRRSRLKNAADLPDHLRDGLAKVDVWFATKGGLLLSPNADECLLELRRSVRSYLEASSANAGAVDTKSAIERIWDRKNELRRALRGDLGLLFSEDT